VYISTELVYIIAAVSFTDTYRPFMGGCCTIAHQSFRSGVFLAVGDYCLLIAILRVF